MTVVATMQTEFCTELIGFIIVWFAMWARKISTRTLSVLLIEAETCLRISTKQGGIKPRSQGLPSLPHLVVGTETLGTRLGGIVNMK